MMATLQKNEILAKYKEFRCRGDYKPLFTPVKGVVFKQGFRLETVFITRRNC